MRALITGVNGFVGEYLSLYLQSKGIEVYGTDIVDKNLKSNIKFIRANLLDQESIDNVIKETAPDCIYHLAGQSNVGVSWVKPSLTINVNTMGIVNLLESVRGAAKKARILIIGTADQYGVVTPEMCPLNEEMPINPQSPYALSKSMQEQVARFYIRTFGLDIVLVRAFNHIGPGQNLGFVVPDFASRIAQIEMGLLDKMEVGNLEAARDFSDVRDIVCGYYMLMDKGRIGEVYNIGSGKPKKITEILRILISYSKADIKICEDPSKMRPSDAPLIYADCTKIREQVGYMPERSIEETLREVLEYWRLHYKNNMKKEDIK